VAGLALERISRSGLDVGRGTAEGDASTDLGGSFLRLDGLDDAGETSNEESVTCHLLGLADNRAESAEVLGDLSLGFVLLNP